MKTSEAILSLSQSEKVKSGLIWATQLMQMREASPAEQRGAADRTVEALIGMIGHETRVIRNITGEKDWQDAESSINMALVMIRSKVPEEANFHLTKAMTHVTSLGYRAMTALKERGLL
jgi:hypothetical protein